MTIYRLTFKNMSIFFANKTFFPSQNGKMDICFTNTFNRIGFLDYSEQEVSVGQEDSG